MVEVAVQYGRTGCFGSFAQGGVDEIRIAEILSVP